MCSDECGPLSPALCGARCVLVDLRDRSYYVYSRTILYPKLEDHDIVRHYPPVQGIEKNVFFFSHSHKENAEDDSVSKYNTFEVCRYIGLESRNMA